MGMSISKSITDASTSVVNLEPQRYTTPEVKQIDTRLEMGQNKTFNDDAKIDIIGQLSAEMEADDFNG